MTIQEQTVATGEFNYFLPFAKVEKNDDGSRTVTGYASTERRDLDGEIVSLDAVKAALPAYMEWRNIRLMHQPVPIGIAKEAHTDDHGLFVTSRIVSPEAIKLLDEEVLKGYSVGGKKLSKRGDTITAIELVEISLVDRPANPDCRIDVIKSARTVQAGGFDVAAEDADTRGLLRKILDVVSVKAAPVTKVYGDDGYADLCKRAFSDKERADAANDGSAMPDGSFPIKSEQDLKNAVQASGRAKDKDAAKKHIVARAKALKATQHLPPEWEGSTKEEGGSAAAKSAVDSDLAKFFGIDEVTPETPASLVEFAKSADSRFLLDPTQRDHFVKGMGTVAELAYAFSSIRGAQRRLCVEGAVEKDGDDAALATRLGSIAKELAEVIGDKATHEGSEAIFMTDEDDLTFMTYQPMGVFEMAEQTTDLAKRASAKVKENLGKAAGHMRKAGKAQSDGMKCFGKAAKKIGEMMNKNAEFRDAFTKAAAGDESVGKLFKAANDAFNESSDHMEMAHGALGKAASGWVGQGGSTGAMDAGDGWHENPKFVEAIPQSKMTEGDVPWYDADEPYANKGASVFVPGAIPAGYISPEQVALMVKNATLEGQLAALEKNPSNPRRAVNFMPGAEPETDETKASLAKMLDGVDLSHENAPGLIIGNMIANKMGKSVIFDPNFRGLAGTGRNN